MDQGDILPAVGGQNYYLVFRGGDENAAELFREYFQLNLADMMADIRKSAYNKGWKDKASHHARKQKYFPTVCRRIGT